MSLTNGSFSSGLIADIAKGSAAFAAEIPAGLAFLAGIVLPNGPQQGMTIYNVSGNLLRGVITYAPGTTFTGPPLQQAFLIPAGGVYSVDLSDDGTGDFSAIASVTLEAVGAPVGVQEASTLLAAAPANVAGGNVFLNFATD